MHIAPAVILHRRVFWVETYCWRLSKPSSESSHAIMYSSWYNYEEVGICTRTPGPTQEKQVRKLVLSDVLAVYSWHILDNADIVNIFDIVDILDIWKHHEHTGALNYLLDVQIFRNSPRPKSLGSQRVPFDPLESPGPQEDLFVDLGPLFMSHSP